MIFEGGNKTSQNSHKKYTCTNIMSFFSSFLFNKNQLSIVVFFPYTSCVSCQQKLFCFQKKLIYPSPSKKEEQGILMIMWRERDSVGQLWKKDCSSVDDDDDMSKGGNRWLAK
jgi:hypothetical protein